MYVIITWSEILILRFWKLVFTSLLLKFSFRRNFLCKECRFSLGRAMSDIFRVKVSIDCLWEFCNEISSHQMRKVVWYPLKFYNIEVSVAFESLPKTSLKFIVPFPAKTLIEFLCTEIYFFFCSHSFCLFKLRQ